MRSGISAFAETGGFIEITLGNGEYATLIGALQGHGYAQREGLRRFQLLRQVAARDGGEAIDVVVDFLMPRDAEIVKNDPPLISDFAVQRADGADLAMRFYQLVAVAGPMPDGGTNRVEIAVCSIPALLAMKGHALAGRYKQKDAYDIYYCVRNYPDGIDALARGMSAAAGACKRRTRLPVHRREVRHLRGIRAYLREMQRHTTARCDEIAKRALILYSDDIFPALITWRR